MHFRITSGNSECFAGVGVLDYNLKGDVKSLRTISVDTMKCKHGNFYRASTWMTILELANHLTGIID